MQLIQVLPDTLVSQIAAGEVIERPASVVKELVENALDAGATRVEIHIREGGVRAISVRDDGCGMSARDAVLAFRRHATSKIRAFEDLCSVNTLGFRGEALPSIASVAHVRMRTRRTEDALGVEVIGEGDRTTAQPVSCPEGTLVEVNELFHAVPARRKFLKGPATEATHIVRWLEEIGLVRPDVRFVLSRDGRESWTLLPTADPRERVSAVLPARLGERLREVSMRGATAELRGFASPTDVIRATASDIHLFVNSRPVRDRVLLSAVREAYRDALPPGRSPAVVLYLQIDPDQIDANVHPTKIEVRFRDARAVHQLVREGIARAVGMRSAARTHAGAAVDVPLHPTQALLRAPAEIVADAPRAEADGAPAWTVQPPHAPQEHVGAAAPAVRTQWALPIAASQTAATRGELREHRYVGQLLGTYLILERSGGIVVLDQHAAHERVLFEQVREAALAGKLELEKQSLLVPLWLELARSTAEALHSHKDALAASGFDVEWADTSVHGGVRIAVRSIPALLRPRPGKAPIDHVALLEETAAALLDPHVGEARDGIAGAIHHVLATTACHAAVRKGDRLQPEEVMALLSALDRGLEFANCPHGRPIAWTLEEREIARHFLRPIG